ncbi:MAG: hypothetical protein JSV30_06115 [Candidatus Omnitrophota bacterium]|nr:MAG: hypothetical protein JSV30_06115 [Candidatus Omnitrophota bacterium]
MREQIACLICKEKFSPNKYRKNQKVCSRPECQRERQIRNQAAWRQRNPGYFKVSGHDSSWAKLYRQRSRMWRKKHPDKVKKYKKAHKEEQKEYMREYMHRLRGGI